MTAAEQPTGRLNVLEFCKSLWTGANLDAAVMLGTYLMNNPADVELARQIYYDDDEMGWDFLTGHWAEKLKLDPVPDKWWAIVPMVAGMVRVAMRQDRVNRADASID